MFARIGRCQRSIQPGLGIEERLNVGSLNAKNQESRILPIGGRRISKMK